MQRRGFFGAFAGALAGVASLKLIPKASPPALPIPPPPLVEFGGHPTILIRTLWLKDAGFPGYTRVRSYVEGSRVYQVQDKVDSCPYGPLPEGHRYEFKHV
jgi:hypothetical protein